jgi:hypothetical protein
MTRTRPLTALCAWRSSEPAHLLPITGVGPLVKGNAKAVKGADADRIEP